MVQFEASPDQVNRVEGSMTWACDHSAIGRTRAARGREVPAEIVLFRIHTRKNVDGIEYEIAFKHMLELVSEVPGFLGIEGFTGEDGSEFAVARFDSPEAIARWRDHPEHVRTRERGREEFFASYEITIATTWKQHGWNAADGTIQVTEDPRREPLPRQ